MKRDPDLVTMVRLDWTGLDWTVFEEMPVLERMECLTLFPGKPEDSVVILGLNVGLGSSLSFLSSSRHLQESRMSPTKAGA